MPRPFQLFYPVVICCLSTCPSLGCRTVWPHSTHRPTMGDCEPLICLGCCLCLSVFILLFRVLYSGPLFSETPPYIETILIFRGFLHSTGKIRHVSRRLAPMDPHLACPSCESANPKPLDLEFKTLEPQTQYSFSPKKKTSRRQQSASAGYKSSEVPGPGAFRGSIQRFLGF